MSLEEAAAALVPQDAVDCGSFKISRCLSLDGEDGFPKATPSQSKGFECILGARSCCEAARIGLQLPTIDSGPVNVVVAVVPDADGCHFLEIMDNRGDKYADGGLWSRECGEVTFSCTPLDIDGNLPGCGFKEVE